MNTKVSPGIICVHLYGFHVSARVSVCVCVWCVCVCMRVHMHTGM